MDMKDISKHFSSKRFKNVPVYKLVLAVCCAILLVAGTGFGIYAGASAASSSAPESAIETPQPTATPTPTATPSPSPTPEPVAVELEIAVTQQDIGITVMDIEEKIPMLEQDFEIVLECLSLTKVADTKANSSATEIKKGESKLYAIDPETGTLLIESLPPGEYRVTISAREGFVVPETPYDVKVQEKVVYKADTEAVKDKIKNESEVGAGDIVTDNKNITDETGGNFDPIATATPRPNDYTYNKSETVAIKGSVYKEADANVTTIDGKSYLYNADGSVSNYYVSEWGTAVDGTTRYIVAASLDANRADSQSASSVASMVAAINPLRWLSFTAYAEGESDEGTSSSVSDSSGSVAQPSEEPTASPTPTPTPTASPSPTPTASPSPTPTASPTATPPASVALFDKTTNKAIAASQFKLTLSEVEISVTYKGWQPSTTDKKYYYDPETGKKVTGEKAIAGTTYTFNSEGLLIKTGTGTSGKQVRGIDVSKYQGNIDWKQVKASGIDFAIIRVGYRGYGTGALVEDSTFKQNIQGATAAGVKVGLYFYSQAITEAEAVEEASMVLRLCKGYNISYPIYFDTEKVANATGRADNISAAQRTACAVAFCETIQNAGYRAGVYSYRDWFYYSLNMANISKYSTWIAQYRTSLDFKYSYDIWQYSSTGKVPGISVNCDMNVSTLG